MLFSIHILLVLALYGIITSITPGPNNTMLLASGINFGFKRSLPHILGISSGFFLMIICLGLGLESIFSAYPIVYTILRYLSALYLLYLAWKIARTQPVTENSEQAHRPIRPINFWGAATFQWVNPKTWMMAISAISEYLPQNNALNSRLVLSILFLASIYAIINAPCVGIWALLGSLLHNILQDPHRRKIINRIMALLLVISLYPILTST